MINPKISLELIKNILAHPNSHTAVVKALPDDQRNILNTAANLMIATDTFAFYERVPTKFWKQSGKKMCQEKIAKYTHQLCEYFVITANDVKNLISQIK